MWFGGFNDAVLDQKWCGGGEDPLLLGKRPIFMGALLIVLGKIFYEANLVDKNALTYSNTHTMYGIVMCYYSYEKM